MTEKKFNLYFSLFLLLGMVAVATVNSVVEFKNPDTKVLIQIIAGVGAIMGVVNTVLSANASVWTFLFGFLDVVCCSIVYFDSGVMGVCAEHVFYFLPMQFVGWWQWRKRGAGTRAEINEKGEKEVAKVRARRLGGRQWLYVALVFVFGTAILFTILYYIDRAALNSGRLHDIDEAKLVLDASIVMLNLIGQFLMSTAYTEQWFIWNFVNVCSILLWANRLLAADAGSYTMVMLVKYCLYLLNSINGLRIWLRLGRKQGPQGAPRNICC